MTNGGIMGMISPEWHEGSIGAPLPIGISCPDIEPRLKLVGIPLKEGGAEFLFGGGKGVSTGGLELLMSSESMSALESAVLSEAEDICWVISLRQLGADY